jgi:hypothetical protein
MGADVVVVGDEAIDLGLQPVDRRRPRLPREALEGQVEALDLATGLGVIGPGALARDPEAEQLGLQRRVAAPIAAV